MAYKITKKTNGKYKITGKASPKKRPYQKLQNLAKGKSKKNYA